MGVQIPRGFYPQVPQKNVVRAVTPASWRGIQEPCGPEGKQGRGGAFDGGSCAHAVIYSAQVRGGTGGGLHEGQERNPPSTCVWRAKEELRGAKFLGQGLLCLDGGAG